MAAQPKSELVSTRIANWTLCVWLPRMPERDVRGHGLERGAAWGHWRLRGEHDERQRQRDVNALGDVAKHVHCVSGADVPASGRRRRHRWPWRCGEIESSPALPIKTRRKRLHLKPEHLGPDRDLLELCLLLLERLLLYLMRGWRQWRFPGSVHHHHHLLLLLLFLLDGL